MEKGVEKRDKKRSFAEVMFDWLDNILFGLIVVIMLLTFVFKTYTVEGTSMLPTLESGDFVIAYSFLYTPKQGDVVIIDDNNDLGKPLVKRVVAVEGQAVVIDENGVITVDGVIFEYDGDNPNNVRGDCTYPLIVPKGYVFVMGDNRAVSNDSRYNIPGLIDVRSIVGKEIHAIKS